MTNSVITINNHTSNGDPWEDLEIQRQADEDECLFDSMDDPYED
jgi:hypothetical protein